VPETVKKEEIVKDSLMDEEARIKGTRIRVSDIAVNHDYHELSPEEIAEEFHISVSQVYSALSYYRDNPEEIRKAIQERESKFGKVE